MRAFQAIGASALFALLLAGCSGSGGSNATPTPTPAPSPAQRPPSFSSGTATSVVENVTGAVYQAAASDPEGDPITYSIAGGADAARFAISGAGQLSFVAPPNYDLPVDADRNNVYEVQIGASDGKATTTLALAVTVTNSKEGIAVRRVASGFVDPVAIAPISASLLLVAEKAGAVYQVNPQTAQKSLLVRIANVGGVGVVAIAAAPDYATSGTFFAMYASESGALVVHRFLRNPAGPIVPDNYGPIFVAWTSQYAGGGWLGFDAAGTLLAATGDAGGTSDPAGSAQDGASLLGKLVRITPNPDPYAGAAPRFFLVSTVAKGLHRPNGGSLLGNSLLIADRGQDLAEEINLFATGATAVNFGWPFKEGTRAAIANPPSGLTDPVLEYYRSTGLRTGQAVIGGGMGPSGVASLRGQYVFGDAGGAIFTINANLLAPGTTGTAEMVERRDADFAPDVGSLTRPLAITPGPGATLFILDAGGDIFRVDGS
ncbi:hypothetical protein ABIC65_004390 [Sphingomonas trueperi]|uniref:PQQ-dependent sugar dehydrogenase n=1 Tax=Sphingomonas trueperi TaxID=53317 RepID=UPI0033971C03